MMDRTRSVRAVEDRIALFEIGKDLDEHRLGLLLEMGRQLRVASAAEEDQNNVQACRARTEPTAIAAHPGEGSTQ